MDSSVIKDRNYTCVKTLRGVLVAAMTLLTSGSAMADGVVVKGNVYGGGNLADVKTNTEVNMSAGTVEGNVYGGGELGIVKGAVLVNMNGGTIEKDVYGGGALANTNTNNWNGSTLSETYLEVSGLTVGESSVVGYYTESSGTYTLVTSGTAEVNLKSADNFQRSNFAAI